MTARIAPLAPPYAPDVQAVFDVIMPPGLPPLALFTTLARDPRLFARFRGGALLDRGHLSLREREIIIHRTTARCGSEYEWGVHAAFFAARADLDDAQLAATVHGPADAACWSAVESMLIETCDQLNADADISDDLWSRLKAKYADTAIIEIVLLVGFYRTVSCLTAALRLPLEPYGKRFPAAI